MRLRGVVAAGVLCAAFAACGGDDGGSGGSASEGQDCSGTARTAEQITGDLRQGWTTAAAPEKTIQQFREMLAGADQDEGKIVKITGRSVARRAEGGVVLVLESDKPVKLDDIVEGAEEGSGGKQPTTERLGDDPEGGRMVSTDDGGASLFGVTEECSAVIVLGTSPVIAKRVASMLSL